MAVIIACFHREGRKLARGNARRALGLPKLQAALLTGRRCYVSFLFLFFTATGERRGPPAGRPAGRLGLTLRRPAPVKEEKNQNLNGGRKATAVPHARPPRTTVGYTARTPLAATTTWTTRYLAVNTFF